MRPLQGQEIALAVQLSCQFEVMAHKPGNVSPRARFADVGVLDFLTSAAAIGPPFAAAGERGVGQTIREAVAATRQVSATNTNLGIVLLLAPLAKAAAMDASQHGLRDALRGVLAGLSVEDARSAYAAIAMAQPGGLGRVQEHDVAGAQVDVSLLEAMRSARDRDSIAREYLTDYQITFQCGAQALSHSWQRGDSLSVAITTAFLQILSEVPDTLIARKLGEREAAHVSRRACEVLDAGGLHTELGRREVQRLDDELRDDAHRLNPGTTADLIAASLFVFLTEGGMLADVPELTTRW